MKRVLIAALSSLLLVLLALPAFAQTTSSRALGLGMYWLVDDNAWDGVWMRQGESNQFDARWSLSGEEDITADLTIILDGDTVVIQRVDPPNKWEVTGCRYTGEFDPDGVTVSGKTTCTFESGATDTLDWSATVVYETPNISWFDNAIRYRAAKNSSFDFNCPFNSTFVTVWGTDIYTDDSGICTAAVHAGLIQPSNGGLVTLTILPGQDSYEGTVANGVSTNNYGEWRASFRFDGAVASTIPRIDWDDYAVQYRGENGQQYTFECIARGGARPVWGTDVYTDDSSICAAAVHAGVITDAGGIVTIEIAPGRDSYKGSERNGIPTRDYGSWAGSFRFV
jgi:hypothetical protein